MKRFIIAILMLLTAAGLSAQDRRVDARQPPIGSVKGTVVSRQGRAPIGGAVVTLLSEGQELYSLKTGSDGTFQMPNIANGRYMLTFSAPGYTASVTNVLVEGFVRDLMFITLSPLVTEERTDVDDDNFIEFDLDDSGYSDTPSILFGSNDVYDNAVSYGFSSIRFKNRGYNSELQDVMLSGVRLNDALTGYSPYSLWSGLNEVMRSKDVTSGLQTSPYAIGGFNGVTNILGNPADVRPGLRLSVLSNSALYRLRLMATYSSGVMDNGWSYVVSASARLGGNDWVKGVYYRSFAYYAGAEKSWDAHRISLFTFATPGQRGAQNASTQEVYDLMGDNMYNSNWGYQNGKMRNARVRKTFEPITVLKYTYSPDMDFESATTLLWRTGSNGYTALDWYDAPDPRPDYYKNLPSYAFMEDEDYGKSNVDKADWMREAWVNRLPEYAGYQHIDWDRLYRVNYAAADGRAKYVQEERHVDQNELNLAETIKWRANEHNLLHAGAYFKWNRSENYKKIADLLGGRYFLDIDSFAERDYAIDPVKLQNDLDYYLAHGEARKLYLGDKYGYDYLAQIRKAGAWVTENFEWGGWSANAAASVGYETFWRDGLVRKGLFPDDSRGQSRHANFLVYSGKVGLAYVIPTGHRFSVNAGYFNDAPTFNQSFISPRTRNTMMDGLTTKKTLSADVNYQFNSMGYNLRLTGFWTQIKDQTDLMSFYDDREHTFTNFAMTGIDQRHMGIELGVKVPLFAQGLSASGILSMGEYIYTSTPHMVQTIDNSAEIVHDEDVPYWKEHTVADENGVVKTYKHYVPSTPQLAAQIGLNYNVNYWYLELNAQYFAHSYLDMNPGYRTHSAVGGPDGIETPAEIAYMAAQEEFAPAFLLNASIGKSWYVNNNQIGFSLQLNNMTNNRGVKTGGYEQTRLIDSSDKKRSYRFDSKYFYMQGFNYMLNIYFRF